MKFYTDVSQRGNTLFLRGKDNGKRIQRKIEYKPYLFVPSKAATPEYRSLFGQQLDKIDLAKNALQFDIGDRKSFVLQSFALFASIQYLPTPMGNVSAGNCKFWLLPSVFLFVGVACRSVFASTLRILNHQLQIVFHQIIPGRRRKTIYPRARAGQICWYWRSRWRR
jgi:hypothetical protein